MILLDRLDAGELERLFSTVGVPVIAVLGLIALFLAYLSIRTIRLKPASGSTGMMGLTGVVRKAGVFRGFVLVEVRGELWWARCSSRVKPGGEVEVTGLEGMLLQVRAIDGADTDRRG